MAFAADTDVRYFVTAFRSNFVTVVMAIFPCESNIFLNALGKKKTIQAQVGLLIETKLIYVPQFYSYHKNHSESHNRFFLKSQLITVSQTRA